ncbi:MAG: MFS transporter [Qingshengfaniella sp.]
MTVSPSPGLDLGPRHLLPMIGLPVFLAIANQTMVSVALPAIGADLGTLERLPWLVIGYMLALTISGPVYGVLGDIWGRPRMLQTALGLYAAGTVLAALAETIEVLALGRIVQGLGGGGLMSLSQALIGDTVSPRNRGRAQGYVATLGVLANTLGPLLSGLFVAYLGWRALFLMTLPLALLAGWSLWRADLPRKTTGGRRFDLGGFTGLLLLVFGLTALTELLRAGQGGSTLTIATLTCLAGIALLIAVERRAQNALFPPDLLARPAISRAAAMALFHGAALVSFITVVPLFHAILRADGSAETGLSMLALTVAFGVGGMVTGNLITWTGRTALFPTLSLPIALAGLLTIGSHGADWPRAGLLAVYTLTGLSLGTVMATVHTTVQSDAPDRLRGRAAGLITFFRSIGAIAGTSIVSLVLFRYAPIEAGASAGTVLSGSVHIDPATLGGWHSAFRASFITIAVFTAGTWAMAVMTPARRVAD